MFLPPEPEKENLTYIHRHTLYNYENFLFVPVPIGEVEEEKLMYTFIVLSIFFLIKTNEEISTVQISPNFYSIRFTVKNLIKHKCYPFEWSCVRTQVYTQANDMFQGNENVCGLRKSLSAPLFFFVLTKISSNWTWGTILL